MIAGSVTAVASSNSQDFTNETNTVTQAVSDAFAQVRKPTFISLTHNSDRVYGLIAAKHVPDCVV